MPEVHVVCAATDIPEGEGRRFRCGNEEVAVFNIGGTFYACTDACPHAGGPLHQGFLEGTVVTCPWHGWDFDLNPATPDPCDGVVRFPVRVEDGKVLVEV